MTAHLRRKVPRVDGFMIVVDGEPYRTTCDEFGPRSSTIPIFEDEKQAYVAAITIRTVDQTVGIEVIPAVITGARYEKFKPHVPRTQRKRREKA